MHAVIFEVWPKEGYTERYLDLAGELRQHLESFEGFISIERFRSLTDEKKLLSLSFWKDEESIRKWKAFDPHLSAQKQGAKEFFLDYRIRVCSISRDYTLKTSKNFSPN